MSFLPNNSLSTTCENCYSFSTTLKQFGYFSISVASVNISINSLNSWLKIFLKTKLLFLPASQSFCLSQHGLSFYISEGRGLVVLDNVNFNKKTIAVRLA